MALTRCLRQWTCEWVICERRSLRHEPGTILHHSSCAQMSRLSSVAINESLHTKWGLPCLTPTAGTRVRRDCLSQYYLPSAWWDIWRRVNGSPKAQHPGVMKQFQDLPSNIFPGRRQCQFQTERAVHGCLPSMSLCKSFTASAIKCVAGSAAQRSNSAMQHLAEQYCLLCTMAEKIR